MSDKNSPERLSRLKRLLLSYRGWIFPAVLTALLVVFTALSISGSSIGVYDSLLGETNHNLIGGTPRPIRSDEWLVNTPLTLSQKTNGYKVVNPAMGRGSDTSIVVDVPYKEWSILFKPQNLAFFVLPFSMAFAFKWWLLLYLLMLSVYVFVITTFPRRYLLAGLLAVFFGFSPYIQWWYQSITILPVAYMLLLVSLALRTLETGSLKKKTLGSATICYIGACFALLLYPPYQIMSALVGLVLFASIYLARYGLSFGALRKLLWLVVPLLGSGLIFGAFLLSHKAAVSAELGSVYPGHRTVHAGGMSLLAFFSWPLSYLLLRENLPNIFGTNQSESSNFLLFGLCIAPYLFYYLLIVTRQKLSRGDEKLLRLSKYISVGAFILMAIFLARMFLPWGDLLYGLLGLGSILHDRLFLAIGVISCVLVAIAIELPSKSFNGLKSLWSWPAAVMGGAWLIIFVLLFRAIKLTYGLPGTGKFELVAVALFCSLMIALLCHQIKALRYLGLAGILAYALFVAAPVNPLYKGLGALQDSRLSRQIVHVSHSDPGAAWVVVNKVQLEQIPTVLGVKNFSGVYPYPQVTLWKNYFPGEASTYNRYAHVTFNVNDAQRQHYLGLVQQDTFSVNINSCDSFLSALNIKYLVEVDSPTAQSHYKCYKPYASVPVQKNTILIYKHI